MKEKAPVVKQLYRLNVEPKVVDQLTKLASRTVEPLAMFPIMQSMDAANHFNARVEPLRTRFMATGTPEQVTTFLADVTRHLSHLALDRLENEKKILRTEAANKPWGSLKMAWSF